MLLNCGLCGLKLRVDFARKGEEQTGAVFNLVACPFVLYSHVWRHAHKTQASLYAETATVARRAAGPPPPLHRLAVGGFCLSGCGPAHYFRCEKIVVPCWETAEMGGI